VRKWVVLFLALVSVVLLAQDKDRDEQIRKTLKTTSLNLVFNEIPLSEALFFLKGVTQLEFKTSDKIELGSLLVTMAIRGEAVTVEEVLKLMLEPHGLDYIVKNGVVFVSTKEHIAELKGKDKEKKVGLRSGELLFVLKDGSRLKGVVSARELRLKTAYGVLSIPLSEVRRVRLSVAGKDGVTEDEVETVKFVAKGVLEVAEFVLETAYGTLKIEKDDIVEIVFSEASVVEKEFEVKPTETWLSTGIELREGDELEITATGSIALKGTFPCVNFLPDGRKFVCGGEAGTKVKPFEGKRKCPLVGRIGYSKAKPFTVGACYRAEVEQDGILYLRIEFPMELKERLKGAYKVKVRVVRGK